MGTIVNKWSTKGACTDLNYVAAIYVMSLRVARLTTRSWAAACCTRRILLGASRAIVLIVEG